jgi:hypothetical protein|tara:strand:- start:204 stop:584 length:381 start_codon:yes stop_codon:yes gene_type:complete
MSIQLEFINFVVPRRLIEQKYPGGWVRCLSNHKDLIGGRVWYDEHLFRDGAMNPMDVSDLVSQWSNRGFYTHEGGDSPTKWVDVCVLEALFGGATLPCDWIEVEGDEAYLKGSEKGVLMSRDSFSV